MIKISRYNFPTKQRAEAAEVLRGLIDRIVITTDKATGKPVVDLEGDLAGILSLCHTSKNAASVTEDDVSQISVVAGAHNRRHLLFVTRGLQERS